MNVFRMARLGSLLGLLVVLLVACGKNAAVVDSSSTPVAGPSSTPPSADDMTASPQAEGTGAEHPQARGRHGVSLSVAPLPIGNNDTVGVSGNNQCITFQWIGGLPQSGATITITQVNVTPPFSLVDLTAANCPGGAGPACQGLQLNAASGSTSCYVGVGWDPGNTLGSDGSAETSGELSLSGSLSCPHGDRTACGEIVGQIEGFANAQGASINLDAPSSPDSQGSTDNGSQGSTDNGSQGPTDTGSPGPTATSSP